MTTASAKLKKKKPKVGPQAKQVGANGPLANTTPQSPGAEQAAEAFDDARLTFSSGKQSLQSVAVCPLKAAAAAAALNPPKKSPAALLRCRNTGLTVSCGHGRNAGVLPAWAENFDPTSPGLTLQVLHNDKITAKTKKMAGPCGDHQQMIQISNLEKPVPAGAAVKFEAPAPEVDWWDDMSYVAWPSPARFLSYEVTAETCSGFAGPVALQVFPEIENSVKIAIRLPKVSANPDKPGGAKGTYETTFEKGVTFNVSLKVNGTTRTLKYDSSDEKSRYRSLIKVSKALDESVEWLSKNVGKLAGMTVEYSRPNIELQAAYGWKEESGSCACGMHFKGGVKANPLFGLKLEKDIANYVFSWCPAAIALKETLERSKIGELKILLSVDTKVGGELKGDKNLSTRVGTFNGSIDGEIGLGVKGLASGKFETFVVSVTTGVSLEATTGLKASLKGGWENEEGPFIMASLSFSGLIIKAVAWFGVNSTLTSGKKKRDKTKRKADVSKSADFPLIEPKEDFLSTPKIYPFS